MFPSLFFRPGSLLALLPGRQSLLAPILLLFAFCQLVSWTPCQASLPPRVQVPLYGVSGKVGVPLSYAIEATQDPTRYGASGLPPGLTLDPASGIISGEPAVFGTFLTKIEAVNEAGSSATLNYGGGLSSIAFIISESSSSPPVIETTQWRPFYTWPKEEHRSLPIHAANLDERSVFSYRGELPPGVSLRNGQLEGAPGLPGLYDIGIFVNNQSGADVMSFVIYVPSVPSNGSDAPTITLPEGPFTWSLDAFVSISFGSSQPDVIYQAAGLPEGMTIEPDSGILKGAPRATGTYQIVVQAINPDGASSAVSISADVVAAPSLEFLDLSPSSLLVGRSANMSFSLPYYEGYETTITVDNLPPGLIQSSNRHITGVPTEAGIFDTTFTAVNSEGSDVRTIPMVVTQSPWKAYSYSNGTFQDVAFGGGIFARVGFDGLIATSSDGVTWTDRDSGSTEDLNSIAYSGDRFVAVGDSGTVLISDDGVTWNLHDAGTNASLKNVAAEGNRILAEYGLRSVLVSVDGLSWLTSSVPGSGTFSDVFIQDEEFIVATEDAKWISNDGEVWSAEIPLNTNAYVDLGMNQFGDDFMRITGDPIYPIETSTNGIDWTPRRLGPANRVASIAYGNDIYVVLGSFFSDRYTLVSSGVWPTYVDSPLELSAQVREPFEYRITGTEGATAFGVRGLPGTLHLNSETGVITGYWEEAGTSALELFSINANGPSPPRTLIVKVQDRIGERPQLLSPRVAGGQAGVPFHYKIETSVASDENVITTEGLPAGLVLDPETQTISGTPAETGIFDVTLLSANYYGENPVILKVVIGQPSWHHVEEFGYFVWHVNGKFIMTTAYSSGVIRCSSDGVNWQEQTVLAGARLLDLAYGNGLYVLTGEDRVFTSTDLESWSMHSLHGKGALNSITFGEGRFVAVRPDSHNNEVGTSANGEDWNFSSLPTEFPTVLTQVVHGPNGFIVAGDEVFHSPDGLTWSRVSLFSEDMEPFHVEAASLFTDGSEYIISDSPNWFRSENGIDWSIWPKTYPQGDGLLGRIGQSYMEFSGFNGPLYSSYNGIDWTLREGVGDLTDIAVGSERIVATGRYDFWYGEPGWSHILERTGPLITKVGENISFTIQSDAAPSEGYYLYPLPPGLQFDAQTGILSGSPTLPGSYHLIFCGITPEGPLEPSILPFTIYPESGKKPGIGDLIDFSKAYFNQSFSDTLDLSDLDQTSNIYVEGLPDGLSLDTDTMTISGRPKQAGSFEIRVIASNVHGTTEATGKLQVTHKPFNYRAYNGANVIGEDLATNGTSILMISSGNYPSHYASAIQLSLDGVHWQTVEETNGSSSDPKSLTAIAWGDTKFIAVGQAGRILQSSDGYQWNEQSLALDEALLGVAYGGNTWVTVGENGTIYTSPDGLTWQDQISGTAHDLNEVNYLNGRFWAVGNSGTLLYSDDGQNWANASFGNKNLAAIAFYQGRYVIGGDYGSFFHSDDGISWEEASSPLKPDKFTRTMALFAHPAVGFLAGGYDDHREQGFLFNSQDGREWEYYAADIPTVRSLLVTDERIYSGMGDGVLTDELDRIPVLNSSEAAIAITGIPFEYYVTAWGSIDRLQVEGLPDGYSFNDSTGLIAGESTQEGEYAVSISAEGAHGTDHMTLHLSVLSGPPSLLHDETSFIRIQGEVGKPLHYSIPVHSLVEDWTLEFTGNAQLPAGISFDSQNGIIHGTPEHDETVYATIVVSNQLGTATCGFQIAIQPPAPFFNEHPLSQALEPGETLRLSATAAADNTGNYQWFRNGYPLADNGRISGAQTMELEIANVSSEDGGRYQLSVDTPWSVSASNPAVVSIYTPAISFSEWIQSKSLSLDQQDEVHDPFGTGVNNFLAYAFGFDPGEATPNDLYEWTMEESMIYVTFRTPLYARALVYEVEASRDLARWTKTEVFSLQVIEESDFWRTYQAAILASEDEQFFRINVSAP